METVSKGIVTVYKFISQVSEIIITISGVYDSNEVFNRNIHTVSTCNIHYCKLHKTTPHPYKCIVIQCIIYNVIH